MTDIAARPLTTATLTALTLLNERMNARVDQIAQIINPIRFEKWGYREKKGSFDRFDRLPIGSFDGYEVSTWDAAKGAFGGEETIQANYSWWCGDSKESTSETFPSRYLDLTDDEIIDVENAALFEVKRQHDEKAARAAEKAAVTRAANLARKETEAREKAAATIPGFVAMPAETQAAIIANLTAD